MRARCVEAIRNISPASKLESRKRVAELLEIPRLRQIVGNLHHLIDVQPEPVAVGDFIANDRAAETCLDHEILSKRPASGSGAKTRDSRRRQEDAVDSQKDRGAAKATPRRRGLKGGYA